MTEPYQHVQQSKSFTITRANLRDGGGDTYTRVHRALLTARYGDVGRVKPSMRTTSWPEHTLEWWDSGWNDPDERARVPFQFTPTRQDWSEWLEALEWLRPILQSPDREVAMQVLLMRARQEYESRGSWEGIALYMRDYARWRINKSARTWSRYHREWMTECVAERLRLAMEAA